MRVAVISDLHIDFSDLTLPGGDVLILSGDVMEARHFKKDMYNPEMVLLEHERKDQRPDRFFRFIEEECSKKYREIVYVMGNHEHYSGDFAKGRQRFEDFCSAHAITNITLLEKDTVRIDGYEFIGGTLWTDFNDMDSYTMFHAEQAMNDYKGVKNTNDTVSWKFLPKHALRDHCEMRGYLQTCMDNYKEIWNI